MMIPLPVHHLIHAGAVFSATLFSAALFTGFFEKLPLPEFFFDTAMLNQLPKTTHGVVHRFIVTQTQTNHTILQLQNQVPALKFKDFPENVRAAISPSLIRRTMSISTFVGTTSWGIEILSTFTAKARRTRSNGLRCGGEGAGKAAMFVPSTIGLKVMGPEVGFLLDP